VERNDDNDDDVDDDNDDDDDDDNGDDDDDDDDDKEPLPLTESVTDFGHVKFINRLSPFSLNKSCVNYVETLTDSWDLTEQT